MTWIKLDDNAVDHPKVASLTDRAFRWWVKALSYASRLLTDGLLPPTFWRNVPKQTRAELTGAKLWDWDDPNFKIHDYLAHQSSREAVDTKRAQTADRVRRFRDGKRNGVTDTTCNALQPRISNAPVTLPETDTETENRDRGKTTTRRPSLIVGGAEFARLQQTHAFVGSVLRVPNVLHAELCLKSGANAEVKLQAWYLTLNDALEESGKGTGDVFEWLRPRHQAHAVNQGWIDAAPKAVSRVRDAVADAAHMARLEAIERGERRR
jgi:hypothetical protein